MRNEKGFLNESGALSGGKVVVILLVAVALVAALVLGLTKCQKDQPEPQGTQPIQTTQATVQTDAPEETEASVPTVTTIPEETQPQATEVLSTETTEIDPQTGVTIYTVTFVDYDGTVLSTQKVARGQAAKAPADPTRTNYTFAGWDKRFNNIISNLVVTATYTTNKTIIYAQSVTVDQGAKEVTMQIRVLNNPGILGGVLNISVDDQVFSLKEAKLSQRPGLNLTASGSGTTASPYTFVLDGLKLSSEDKQDGTLFTVTFKIKDTSAAGKFNVELSCADGAFFKENDKDAKVVLENGIITIG